jgi:hypothetical protein
LIKCNEVAFKKRPAWRFQRQSGGGAGRFNSLKQVCPTIVEKINAYSRQSGDNLVEQKGRQLRPVESSRAKHFVVTAQGRRQFL